MARMFSARGKSTTTSEKAKMVASVHSASSSNAGKQKLKLIYLLKILTSKTDKNHGLSMPQIIDCLQQEGINAERKSLYRDIQILRDAGYDIAVLPTRPQQYAYVRSVLGFDEVMMLVDAVQSSRFLTEYKSNQLVRSLKSLVSDQEKHKLDARVHVYDRIKNQSESVFHSVDKIHEALLEKKKIEFLYFGYDTDLKRKARHGGKRYVLTPVKIVYANANYYLAAYDAEDKKVKTYRIDRMELLQKSAQDADARLEIEDYELEDFDYRIFGMFQGNAARVVLHVDAALMDAVVDEFGQKIIVKKATAKAADIEVKVQVSPQFFGWVAGLNGHVSIKSPKKIAGQYKVWLQNLASQI